MVLTDILAKFVSSGAAAVRAAAAAGCVSLFLASLCVQSAERVVSIHVHVHACTEDFELGNQFHAQTIREFDNSHWKIKRRTRQKGHNVACQTGGQSKHTSFATCQVYERVVLFILTAASNQPGRVLCESQAHFDAFCMSGLLLVQQLQSR